jgi:hypothetical protein
MVSTGCLSNFTGPDDAVSDEDLGAVVLMVSPIAGLKQTRRPTGGGPLAFISATPDVSLALVANLRQAP